MKFLKDWNEYFKTDFRKEWKGLLRCLGLTLVIGIPIMLGIATLFIL